MVVESWIINNACKANYQIQQTAESILESTNMSKLDKYNLVKFNMISLYLLIIISVRINSRIVRMRGFTIMDMSHPLFPMLFVKKNIIKSRLNLHCAKLSRIL